jgi:hypothetical protein
LVVITIFQFIVICISEVWGFTKYFEYFFFEQPLLISVNEEEINNVTTFLSSSDSSPALHSSVAERSSGTTTSAVCDGGRAEVADDDDYLYTGFRKPLGTGSSLPDAPASTTTGAGSLTSAGPNVVEAEPQDIAGKAKNLADNTNPTPSSNNKESNWLPGLGNRIIHNPLENLTESERISFSEIQERMKIFVKLLKQEEPIDSLNRYNRIDEGTITHIENQIKINKKQNAPFNSHIQRQMDQLIEGVQE